MCHLLLGLPLFALPVLWLWPAPLAVPAYAGAVLFSVGIYWYALKVARMPRLNGAQAMLGARGRVVERAESHVTVSYHSEFWQAEEVGEPLAVGDETVVVGIEGLRLRVRKATSMS